MSPVSPSCSLGPLLLWAAARLHADTLSLSSTGNSTRQQPSRTARYAAGNNAGRQQASPRHAHTEPPSNQTATHVAPSMHAPAPFAISAHPAWLSIARWLRRYQHLTPLNLRVLLLVACILHVGAGVESGMGGDAAKGRCLNRWLAAAAAVSVFNALPAAVHKLINTCASIHLGEGCDCAQRANEACPCCTARAAQRAPRM